MTTNIDTAVRLVKQAILQDSKRNYVEAGRCYREALTIFHLLRRNPHTGHRIRDFLATKVVQYEERLRAIDAYLLAQNDWTKFFKDIEPCTGEECGSSSSSRSSETRQLYRNPLLVSALDDLRRGRKADERYEYRSALKYYNSGLKAMQAVINRGILTHRQESAARAKCLVYHDRAEAIRAALEAGSGIYSSGRRYSEESNLSLNSACHSPVPATEADTLLEMDEVHSCSSRLGSAASLHHLDGTLVQHQADKSRAQNQGARSYSQHQLDRSHAVLYTSLPHLAVITPTVTHCMGDIPPGATPCLAYHRSLYSLQAAAKEEAKRQQHRYTDTGKGTDVGRDCRIIPAAASPPLVCLDAELNISSLSLANQHCHDADAEHEADTLEIELLNISQSSEDIKGCGGEYEESDSGYSDPSPDGGSSGGGGGKITNRDDGDTKSFFDEDPTLADDRKSPFSDLSEEEAEADLHQLQQQHDIFPTVIIKNQGEQASQDYIAPSPSLARQYGRQRSVFQTPGKDILTSVVSRDDLAVIGQESVDAPSKSRLRPPVYDETYRRSPDRRRSPHDEAIPSRSTAQQWEKPEKNGCFYVMTALDFCWCL